MLRQLQAAALGTAGTPLAVFHEAHMQRIFAIARHAHVEVAVGGVGRGCGGHPSQRLRDVAHVCVYWEVLSVHVEEQHTAVEVGVEVGVEVVVVVELVFQQIYRKEQGEADIYIYTHLTVLGPTPLCCMSSALTKAVFSSRSHS